MYVLTFKDRTYTCPDGSLSTMARIHALDTDYDADELRCDYAAEQYLISQGFKVTKV